MNYCDLFKICRLLVVYLSVIINFCLYHIDCMVIIDVFETNSIKKNANNTLTLHEDNQKHHTSD